MPGIRVVTDSACDLPAAEVERNGIVVVPLDIRLGELGPDVMTPLSPEEFWAKCAESNVLPETSAPSPGAFRDAFAAAADGGAEAVVCVTISSALSATYQAACTGAKEVADRIDVHVVDSRSVSMGEGLLVLEAARRAEADGAKGTDIAEAVRGLVDKIRVYGTLDTLENLKRGGRIGAAQALLGSLLSIKPVIEVRDGVVESESKQRTRSRSLQYLVDKVKEAGGEVTHVSIMHAMAGDLDTYKKLMAEVWPADKTIVTTIGPVIGTHAGAGAAGVAFQLA
ncbi:MAG TPA: DegV family protein [Acidimicrobiales bacterium]|nr:DegV family protein [Acidimicrobiales bacterium]